MFGYQPSAIGFTVLDPNIEKMIIKALSFVITKIYHYYPNFKLANQEFF